MELLDYIAGWELDYIISRGMPATKMLITTVLEMDDKTYRKEINKLKKKGLIKATRANLYSWWEESTGLPVCGWELTEKARELESVKRIEKEIEERIERVFERDNK